MTRVAAAAHVVAAGLASPGVVRAVIVLLPAASTTGGVALENWPSQAHGLLRGRGGTHLDAIPAPGTATPEPWRLRPGGYTPDAGELAAIDRLWQRLMAPAGEWPDVLGVFEGVQGPPGQRTEAVPLPTAEAGLAIPLERGRRLLEALAAPGSPILARVPTRPGPTSLAAVGRPWLGEPGTLARLASRQPGTLSDAERSLLLGPPDVRDWIAARNSGDKDARRAGDEFYGSALDPDDLADAALGADGRDMLATFDRMHALHHLLVVDGPGGRIPPHDPPLRRVTQLMGSPALLRLFGLAFDVLVELPVAAADGAWRLSWSGVDLVRPCAAKLSRKAPGSGFWPATVAEWTGAAAPSDSVPEEDGVVLLGRGGMHGLVTLEAALAVCGDYHRQVAGDPDHPPGSDPAATPISGGLTVVRIRGTPVRRQANPVVLCSEDLRAFYRFDVGLDVEPDGPHDPGTAWRSVMHRDIRWSDPAAKEERLDLEALLAKLMPSGAGNPCALPRHELEAGICAAVTLTRNDGTRYADPRIAIFNGYPGGEAVNEVWWDGERPLWGHRPISVEAANGLALNQAVSVPRDQPGALIPPLRFGWRYRAGIRIVWLGGVARPIADVADHYRRCADACLPAPGTEGHCYLRHEPVHAPEVFLPPSVPLPRPGGPAEDLLQSAVQAVVVSWPGSAPAGHRAVASTVRVLLPSVVALEFAGLHEVFDGPVRLMDAALAVKPPSADGKDRPPKHLVAKVPADGLRALAFEGAAEFERDKHVAHGSPPRVSVPAPGRPARRPVPYYPDPAACFLAVGLRDPASRR